MKEKIAKILRRLADKLAPQPIYPTDDDVYYKGELWTRERYCAHYEMAPLFEQRYQAVNKHEVDTEIRKQALEFLIRSAGELANTLAEYGQVEVFEHRRRVHFKVTFLINKPESNYIDNGR